MKGKLTMRQNCPQEDEMNSQREIEDLLGHCTICPRECGVNRNAEEKGFCKAARYIEVYSAHLHFGEEPPISGRSGSGTIFFAHCNLHCVYCQNYRLSQIEHGKEFTTKEVADLMLSLEKKGAHNINLVTPTHYTPQLARAITEAKDIGLKLPVVYNSSGYDKIDTLRLLDGLIGIYLVDMRYGNNRVASKYSSCPDYVEINQAAVKEMYRQVGNLKLSNSGIAEKGIIIRHLVLPNGLSGSEEIFRFAVSHLGDEAYISFMSQYYPAYKAFDYKEISRGINKREYDEALSLLYKYNLKNGWIQEYMGGGVDSDFAGTNIQPDV